MRKRIPLLSFFLSLMISGLGQVHNGQLKKGSIYLLVSPSIVLLGALIGAFNHFKSFTVIIGLIVIYKLLVGLEAYRTATKLNESISLAPIQNLRYPVFIVSSLFILWTFNAFSRHVFGYQAFTIPTPSMEPSIQVDDHVMALEIHPDEIKAGDIIVFTREDGEPFLSRVIGLPNQEIQVINDRVLVDKVAEEWVETGIAYDENFAYQEYNSKLPNGQVIPIRMFLMPKDGQVFSSPSSNKEALIVPPDHFYVVSDNRNNAMDSRYYGTIPAENIQKRISYIYWSGDRDRIGLDFRDDL